MAEKTLSVRIQQKSDTALNWLNNNPILLLGEFGVETDTQKMKVGNGVNTWTELPYIISDVDLPIVIEGAHSFKGHIEFQKGINVMNPITLFGNYSISLVNGLSFSGTEIDLGDNKVSLIVRAIDRPTFNDGKKLDKFAFISDIPAVPTKTSELENDRNFATTNQIPTNNNQLTNGAGYITKSSLPTKTSQLTNDSGYITSSSILTNYVTTNTQQEVPAGKLFTKKLNNLESLIGVVSNNHEASIIYRTNRGNDIVAGVGCGGASYANSFSIWDYAVNRVIAHFNATNGYINGKEIYTVVAHTYPEGWNNWNAYIRFGNGDLICYGWIQGNNTNWSQGTATFAQPFAGTYSFTATPVLVNSGNAFIGTGEYNRQAGSCSVSSYGNSTNDKISGWYYVAIGLFGG